MIYFDNPFAEKSVFDPSAFPVKDKSRAKRRKDSFVAKARKKAIKAIAVATRDSYREEERRVSDIKRSDALSFRYAEYTSLN